MTSRYTVIDVAQEICMRARQAKAARVCKCGKPAIEHRREAVCRSCDEDDSERANRALPPELQRD